MPQAPLCTHQGFWEHADPEVAEAAEAAVAAAVVAGAEVVPIDLADELAEVVDIRVKIVPFEFSRIFGADPAARRAAWDAAVPVMGANVHRNAGGLDVTEDEYLAAVGRQEELATANAATPITRPTGSTNSARCA